MSAVPDSRAVNSAIDGDERGGFVKPWMVITLVTLVLGGLIYWGLQGMKGGSSAPKRQTVKIAVLPDTPPPPPPPPKEKPPEPDKQDIKPQQQEQPKPQEAPPEPQQLKMDGPAGDGPSAFAAGAVNSEYKGGDIGTGTGTGTVNKMQFALFSSQLQRHIQTNLSREQSIKLGDYRVAVVVWLSPQGDFLRVELAASSGDPDTDQALKAAFRNLPSISNMPSDLPQPIRLRITNRMTG